MWWGNMFNLLQIQSRLAKDSTETFAFASGLALALALPSALFATAFSRKRGENIDIIDHPKKIGTSKFQMLQNIYGCFQK